MAIVLSVENAGMAFVQLVVVVLRAGGWNWLLGVGVALAAELALLVLRLATVMMSRRRF